MDKSGGFHGIYGDLLVFTGIYWDLLRLITRPGELEMEVLCGFIWFLYDFIMGIYEWFGFIWKHHEDTT